MKNIATTLSLLFLSLSFAQLDEAAMQRVIDEQAIIDTINAIGIYADFDQWERVADQFADEVILDYTSYAAASAGAAEPETISPQEVIAAWQTVLPGYEHTQHTISNHMVDISGDEATAISSVNATHTLENDQGENYWIFVGDYEHHLIRTDEGWKVDRMTANLRSELGNPELPALATERVEAGLGRPAAGSN